MVKNFKPKPENTLEHGHTMLPQYLGMSVGFADVRPNTRAHRSMSEEDDPARARFVEEAWERLKRRAQ